MTIEAIAGLSYSDMLKIRNLGEKSILEIIHEVQKFVPDWIPTDIPVSFLKKVNTA